jgi:hypothetical protein
MPIKFQCPHCKRGLAVKDELAGKRGPCPFCKKPVTVPAAGAAPAPPAPPPAPGPSAVKPAAPPPRQSGNGAGTPLHGGAAPPADVEAEAAALFSDQPGGATAQPQTVDFTCPYCDAELHLSPDLAGKKAPCPNPECRRIIKVPELTKVVPKDWRQVNVGGPSLAKPTTEPAPEGTWSSRGATVVSRGALDEAGVIKKRKRPRTTWQKVRLPLLAGFFVLGALVGAYAWYVHWAQGREMRALTAALGWAENPASAKQVGPAGPAAIFTRAGDYFLRQGKPGRDSEPGSGMKARDRYGKALAVLTSAPDDSERDAALAELAPAVVGLGGEGEAVRQELRQKWNDTQKMLQAAVSAVHSPEGRLDTLRAVARGLIAQGQADRVQPLVGQIYTGEVDKAEALAAVGLEFLAAGDRAHAEKAAEPALSLYTAKEKDKTAKEKDKEPPPVRASVVALAVALDRPVPKAGKGPGEEAGHMAGRAEGLARRGEWEAARKVHTDKYGPQAEFRARAVVALVALEAGAPDAPRDVEEALKFLLSNVSSRGQLPWLLWRLTDAGVRAGLPEETLQALAAASSDPALRGRAQLAVLRAQLAKSPQAAEDAAADKVEAKSVSRLLAAQVLARHNTRRDPDWAKAVPGWDEPRRAFGSLGVVLGLQDRDKGR